MYNRYRSWLCAAGLVLGAAGALGCSGKTEPAKGQLMLSVQTDMAIPKDVDEVRLEVSVYGNILFANSYEVGVGGLKIPATLGLVAGKDPAAPVTIRLIARQKGKLRVLREVITTVPTDRIALLRIPIQWLCEGQASEPTAGQVESSCPEEQTCVAGRCENRHVDSATFPAYQPQDVYGGAAGPDLPDGQCLDTLGCFAQGYIAMLDYTDCSIAAPSGGTGTNVAVFREAGGDGICNDSGCLIPLDAQGLGGWTEEQGRIRLAPAICDRIQEGSARAIAVTTACATKTESIPTCGPWSSVPGTSTADAGAPDGSLEPAEAGVEAGPEDGSESSVQDVVTEQAVEEDGAPPDCTQPGQCCSDGIQNGDEPSTDCGGSCPNRCLYNARCASAGDCITGACNTDGVCSCPGEGTTSGGMIPIESRYCIDITEVTHAQYLAWLRTSPDLTQQPAVCQSNATFVPSSNCLSGIGDCSGPCPDDPQVCVDWCDAYAYCQAMGKRLCGMTDGSAIPYGQPYDVHEDQWYNACSAEDLNEYPYGNTFDPNACNGVGNSITGCGSTGTCYALTVGSMQGCQSSVPGYGGILDLSGNVAEWLDYCNRNVGPDDTCTAIGGDYSQQAQMLTCHAQVIYPRSEASPSVGFRCCSR